MTRSLLVATLVLASCATSRAPEPIGRTTVTAATLPGPVDAAARESASSPNATCNGQPLPSILFSRGSALITADQDAVIEGLARQFDTPSMRNTKLVLVGRTVAEAPANAELGLRRAERVRDFLVAHGVARERVVATSAGDQATATSVPSERVDVVVVYPKPAEPPR
jgi:outer membrane protein OmpA-like peptidoglycan-associated protein